jgi:hypothetical protein
MKTRRLTIDWSDFDNSTDPMCENINFNSFFIGGVCRSVELNDNLTKRRILPPIRIQPYHRRDKLGQREPRRSKLRWNLNHHLTLVRSQCAP